MTTLIEAVDQVLGVQAASGKPLAIIVAGHNGSGKSTMWNQHLAPSLRMPLINADRMMLSILPEPKGRFLTPWAQKLRDEDEDWMAVAQQGVDAFIVQAMSRGVRFATETVFSHWQDRGDGTFASKIDRIIQLQESGYFVLLLFVGLTDAQLSIGRVTTRVASGGHDVKINRLLDRFPRTQKAINAALAVADASILMDNSRTLDLAFTVCRVQVGDEEIFDIRQTEFPVAREISPWLVVVAPRRDN